MTEEELDILWSSYSDHDQIDTVWEDNVHDIAASAQAWLDWLEGATLLPAWKSDVREIKKLSSKIVNLKASLEEVLVWCEFVDSFGKRMEADLDVEVDEDEDEDEE
jgi:hypothetical protein